MSNFNSIWIHEKVKQAFFKLCEKSFEPRVNWKKFRKLDRKGVFAGYTNAQLSMRFRKMWLKSQGLCYYCGEGEPVLTGGLCRTCLDKMGEYVKERNDRIRSELDD